MRTQFQRLATLFKEASDDIVIVCPFIKTRIVEELLGLTGHKVDVYTRWLPGDVAAGVSDLEIFDILMERNRGDLFLLRELHAKAFVSGGAALVGSANLTALGTGIDGKSNVELLVEVSSDVPDVVELLELVRERSTRATRAIQEAVANASALIELEHNNKDGGSGYEDNRGLWLPRCTEPRRLFQVYQGNTRLLDSTVEDALSDLDLLQVPRGLSGEEFIGYVRAMIVQSAIFNVVDRALSAGTEDIPEILGNKFNLEHEVVEADWKVLQSWLLYFFKERFSAAAPKSAIRFQRRRREVDEM